MNMKKMIQRMTDLENQAKQQLNESLEECGDAQMSQNMNPGTPVTMNVNLSASGKDHVDDLLSMMKAAGLGDAKPVSKDMMPMRQDMDRLRAIVGEPEMEADEIYADASDDENLDEAMDTNQVMGQIRRMAKGVETNPDERKHKIFAQQVESELIELFQYFDSQMDTEKKEIVRKLIRQNKKAQQNADLRNANNIVSVLWDLMNSNEGLEEYENEPDYEYSDHGKMIHDLSGGINRKKRSYSAAQDGDNAMAVEDNEDLEETIKSALMKALSEKKAKPDFLDMDGDGNKKEPMKKAIADKKKAKK